MKATLQLALEALEGFYEYGYDRRECFEHITAIKEALAQPEQEPVGKLVSDEFDGHRFISYQNEWPFNVDLYAATPPQRKPLTDEEIMNIAKVSCIGISPHEDTLNFAKVIEAVHGIKE